MRLTVKMKSKKKKKFGESKVLVKMTLLVFVNKDPDSFLWSDRVEYKIVKKKIFLKKNVKKEAKNIMHIYSKIL